MATCRRGIAYILLRSCCSSLLDGHALAIVSRLYPCAGVGSKGSMPMEISEVAVAVAGNKIQVIGGRRARASSIRR